MWSNKPVTGILRQNWKNDSKTQYNLIITNVFIDYLRNQLTYSLDKMVKKTEIS